MLRRFRRAAPYVMAALTLGLVAGPGAAMAQGSAQRQERREEVKGKIDAAEISKIQEAVKKGSASLSEDQKKAISAAIDQAVANKQLTDDEKAALMAVVGSKVNKTFTEEQQAIIVAALKQKYLGSAE